MDVQALWTFCEIVQEIWQDVGSQLITGLALFVWVSVKNSCHGYQPASSR